MPDIRPRTKAPKGEQLKDHLMGELATYAEVGLFQHSINQRTAYRYRGALLRYQQALQGSPPSLESTKIFLAHMREQGFSASSIRIHRAVLQGFHAWRGEDLVFPVKLPRSTPPYIEAETIDKMVVLAKRKPLDYLILLLMAHAGLRRNEVTNLRVKNIGDKSLRFSGKGGNDRTVPMTAHLLAAILPFYQDKNPEDRVLGVGEGVIYRIVKRYGKLIGHPEIKPHDLRHAFATRLLENGVNIRIVQELLGHVNLNTTQIYTSVSGAHLESAITTLNHAIAPRPPKSRVRKFVDRIDGEQEAHKKTLDRIHIAEKETPSDPRLVNHLDELAKTAEVLAHQVQRLIRCEDYADIEAQGDIMGHLSFWRKSNRTILAEGLSGIEEFEYETQHPVDPYLV
jgi:integrase/recombinase XerD